MTLILPPRPFSASQQPSSSLQQPSSLHHAAAVPGTAGPYSRRDFLRTSMALGGGVLLGGALPGCGRSPTAALAPWTPGSDEKPRYGGRLRLGIIGGDQTGNLDAHKPIGGGTIRGFALYSKLWEWSARMTPDLALAETVEYNENASTWTIRLRKGLEFHHGKTISADDVIFSVRRLSDPELASPYARLVGFVDRNRLIKLDERTVRIHFKDDRGFLPLPEGWVNFGGIVPTDYDPITNPVGAGPYKFKEFRPGQRSLFTRFDNYFKSGQPYADELEIIEFKDQISRHAALQSGQIDLINGVSPAQIELFRASDKADLLISETYGWQAFNMNLKKPPFDDVRVRQAFRLFVDREELVARALNGQGRIANDLYSPQDPTFNHSIPQRRQDIAQARALLRAAGVAEGTTIELTTSGDSTAGLVLAEQAKQVGINLRVRLVDAGTFGGPQRNEFTLSTGSLLGQSFLSTALHTDAPLSAANRTQFEDPRFSELFYAALAETDLEKRRQLVHEAQRIQHERGGLLIWGFSNTLDAISRRVGGAEAENSHFPTWRFEKMWLRDRE